MRRLVVIGLAGTIVGSAVHAPVSAQDDARDDPLVLELADRYRPIVMVKAQDGPCDTDGEPFEPAPVEIVLDNPEVFLRQVGNGDPVATRAPGASDIFDLQEGSWYLDFPGDALDPQCTFETDYRRFSAGLPPTVYAHVATEQGRPGMLGLQYWFFWYHNPSKNDHEGDWEFIQLLFDVGTVEKALQTEPIAVGLAQHLGGERAEWSDDRVEKQASHIVVYPAKGSHATYFEQAVFLGRSDEFFGCDNTDEPSRRVDPDVVVLPDEVIEPDDELAWLGFKGRWGQREPGFLNGPTGPAEKARWTAPVTWHDGLRDASVVIPAGDRADSVVATFCTAVEQGSLLLVRTIRSPAILVVLAVLVYLLVQFARQTTWSPVTTQPLRERRSAGRILRGAIRFTATHPVKLLVIGLVAIPVSVLTSLVHRIVLWIPFVDDLIAVAGSRSESAVTIALLVGSLGSTVLYVLVAAAAAAIVDQPHPSRASVGQAIGPLLSTTARAAAIVIGLLFTIVGIPWAIRQLVRYQLIPQVVVLEGVEGKEALQRSSEVVRGRWWWTATLVAVLQFVIGTVGLLFALGVLVAFPGIPLWLFNIFSALVFEFLMPIFGVVMAYVYGSHIARRETDAPAPELASVG
jgi:hypothetical protein